MARMYPQPMRPDTESRAEILLYDLFERDLPDTYHVFHGVAWQARRAGKFRRDGEADFVIIHPEKGILVLEAKAGRIDYDGRTGKWMQNNHNMGKDPFEQAKGSVYHLRNTLEEQPYWRERDIPFGHAVAFTDVVAPQTPLSLQAPSSIVLDKRALEDVEAWVANAYAYYHGGRKRSTIDMAGMGYLIELLAPVHQLRSLIGLDIKTEQQEFIRLTQQQFRLLDFMASTPRAAIAGCAGSGKTLLAAEKARRLAAQGWRVLLTCFNRNLADFLRDDYLSQRPSNLVIANFHRLASDLIQRSGQGKTVGFSDSAAKSHYFRHGMPEDLANAADTLGPQFDAIVVDEAQDFQANWWLPLQLLLEDPDVGTFYIFYDDNQNIYGGLKNVKNLAQGYPLTENFRNTQHINDVVTRFYHADHAIVAMGPEGRSVPLLTYNDNRGLSEHLRRTLHNLVNENEVDSRDIVILTPRGAKQSYLPKLGRLGSFLLTPSRDTDYNEIFYESIYAYKGLESPVVILAEVSADLGDRMDELLYVGCSRARNHLVIICHDDIQDRFMSVESVSMVGGDS